MLSVGVAKTIKKVVKLTGRSGSTIPGKISIKMFKNSLKKSSKYCDRIILVTGTNGKTTMTKYIYEVLSKKHKVLTNKEGANLLSGISTTMLSNQNVFNKKQFDYAVLEVDESTIGKITQELDPDYIIFNNLTMDQVDRHYGVANLAEKINRELKNNKTIAFINANDPYVSYATDRLMKRNIETIYNEDDITEEKKTIQCIDCKNDMSIKNYTEFIFEGRGGIKGEYICPHCNFNSDKNLFKKNFSIYKSSNNYIDIDYKNETIHTKLKGEYHKENLTLIMSLFDELGVEFEDIKSVLEKKIVVPGRNEIFKINNTYITLNLTKNPASFNSYINSIDDEGFEDIYILFGNEIADGKDSSWIKHLDYDTLLKLSTLNRLLVVGKLKGQIISELSKNLYSEIIEIDMLELEEIEGSIEKLVNTKKENSRVLILCNYSMLKPIKKTLNKMGE